MVDIDSPEETPTPARPAFSLEPLAAPAKPTIPLHAWAMVTFAMGFSLSLAIIGSSVGCPLPGSVGSDYSCVPPEAIAVGLGLIMLVGAGAWWSIPSNGNEMRAVRVAGGGALAAGVGMLLLAALTFVGAWPWQLWMLPALAAAPAAMLLAARPDARLAFPGAKGPPLWIRAGAGPSVALFIGVAGGLGVFSAGFLGPNDPLFLFSQGSPLLAPALFLFAGASIRRAAKLPIRSDGRGSTSRASRALALTPMQRNAFLAEVAIAAALAGCATVLFARPWTPSAALGAMAAIFLGGVLGASAFAMLAPEIDVRQGRGRLLSLMPLLAGTAPLLVAAEAGGGGLPFLLGAAALFAFILSSAPQRYALAFDLCPSKGRLRAAMDFQGAKLAAASLVSMLAFFANALLPTIGLLLLSALGLFAFAVFGATLGGLGRRTL